jgi:hypothetical protein
LIGSAANALAENRPAAASALDPKRSFFMCLPLSVFN